MAIRFVHIVCASSIIHSLVACGDEPSTSIADGSNSGDARTGGASANGSATTGASGSSSQGSGGTRPGSEAGSTASGGTFNTTGGAGSGGTDSGNASGGSSVAGSGDGGAAIGGGAGKGGSAQGGTGSTQCQAPAPPGDMRSTIDLTWAEMTGQFEGKVGARSRASSVVNFRNNVLDQVMATGGTLNYCVRWDSNATVSAQMRDQIATALERNVNEWFSKLVGYDCWPFAKIGVKVVGWATRDRDLLKWTDDVPRVYVGDIREDAPQCAQACGRFFHQQPGYAYPDCPGGIANHYDMSLWLTAGMNGGAGGDWGQRVGSEYFTGSVNNQHIHIFLHELGHGLGLPDYYNWDAWVPAGTPLPNSVMVAGRAALVTEWDMWMLRRTYRELKSRWR